MTGEQIEIQALFSLHLYTDFRLTDVETGRNRNKICFPYFLLIFTGSQEDKGVTGKQLEMQTLTSLHLYADFRLTDVVTERNRNKICFPYFLLIFLHTVKKMKERK